MAFTHELTNGMQMFFNGIATVNRIERWVLLAKLKKIVVEEQDKELECPLCHGKLITCECERNLANDILHEIMKKELDKQ